jgi:hypothetical protein
VTENEALLANVEVEFARLMEKTQYGGPTKTEAVNQAQRAPPSVGEAVNEIETVGNLLDAARMACGDLPPDERGPLRTLLSVTRMICATAPGLKRDVRDLIEVASMACGELPPKECGVLRTLLRVASGMLGEAKSGIEVRNDTVAVGGLPGRHFGPGIRPSIG